MGGRRGLARLSCEKVLAVLEGFVRRRIAAAAVLAIGLTFGLAGCTFFTPQATLIHYDPSDGVSLNLGKIQIRNAFVIAPKGTDANFIGAVINNGNQKFTIDLQYSAHVDGKDTVTNKVFTLKSGQVKSFGNPGVPQLVFRDADVRPGALLKIFVVYGTASGPTVSGRNLLLPVLDGSQSYYSGLGPSPLPSPTPTATATN
jgi:hypothetical protein